MRGDRPTREWEFSGLTLWWGDYLLFFDDDDDRLGYYNIVTIFLKNMLVVFLLYQLK